MTRPTEPRCVDLIVVWCCRVRDDELLEKLRRGDTSKLNYFINKPPRWNDQVTNHNWPTVVRIHVPAGCFMCIGQCR